MRVNPRKKMYSKCLQLIFEVKNKSFVKKKVKELIRWSRQSNTDIYWLVTFLI